MAHLTWIKAASRAEVAVGGRLINDPELEPTPYNSRSIVSRAHRNLYIDKKGTSSVKALLDLEMAGRKMMTDTRDKGQGLRLQC